MILAGKQKIGMEAYISVDMEVTEDADQGDVVRLEGSVDIEETEKRRSEVQAQIERLKRLEELACPMALTLRLTWKFYAPLRLQNMQPR